MSGRNVQRLLTKADSFHLQALYRALKRAGEHQEAADLKARWNLPDEDLNQPPPR